MGWEAVVLGGLGALAVSNQIDATKKQAAATEQAAATAKASSDAQLKATQEATNRANPKQADTSALLSAAQQAGKGGASSTMLTGPQGVDTSLLTLGKNTLLGQ